MSNPCVVCDEPSFHSCEKCENTSYCRECVSKCDSCDSLICSTCNPIELTCNFRFEEEKSSLTSCSNIVQCASCDGSPTPHTGLCNSEWRCFVHTKTDECLNCENLWCTDCSSPEIASCHYCGVYACEQCRTIPNRETCSKCGEGSCPLCFEDGVCSDCL
jgi:hypothetical protein